jgi:hypothetical protein
VSPERVFTLVARHAWAMFIVITCLNAATWRWRARRHIAVNPALAPGYRRLIRSWLVFGNVPWVVMGLGIVFGGVVAFWVASVYWIFFRRGAEPVS